MDESTIKSTEIWVTKFDEESAKKFRKAVIEQSREDATKPIVIYIDSYGGFVDSLANMIETLDEIPNPVITACVGKAMSCGAILLSHGDIRFCGKHSRVMVHEVSGGTVGDVHDMHADVQETKRLNIYFMGLLARNCGFKNYDEIRKLIKEQDGRDRYFDAQDALEFGIVDAIGTPKVNAATVYEVRVTPTKPPITRNNKGGIKKKTKKSESKRTKQRENKNVGNKSSSK